MATLDRFVARNEANRKTFHAPPANHVPSRVLTSVRGRLALGFHVDAHGAAILLRLPENGDLHDLVEWLESWQGSPAKQRRVFMHFVRTGLGLYGFQERSCVPECEVLPLLPIEARA
jgi:hypothetical protein